MFYVNPHSALVCYGIFDHTGNNYLNSNQNAEIYYRAGLVQMGKEKIEEAVKLYRLAAEAGHMEAQLMLADLYLTGEGVEKNDREAMHWFQMAALQGNVQAQLSLSLISQKNQSPDAADALPDAASALPDAVNESLDAASALPDAVNESPDEAACCRKPFDANLIYETGQVVQMRQRISGVWSEDKKINLEKILQAKKRTYHHEQSPDAASALPDEVNESLDAVNESPDAAARCRKPFDATLIYEAGQVVQMRQRTSGVWSEDKEINLEKILQAKKRTYHHEQWLNTLEDEVGIFEWYQQRANEGNAAGLYGLSRCYKKGRGVLKDMNKSLMLLKQAADCGEPKAQYQMGKHLEKVEKNFKQAIEWYHRAAQGEYNKAQNRLVKIFSKTKNEWIPEKEEFMVCFQAAHRGYWKAQEMLGNMYREGRGVAKNNSEASQWEKLAKINRQGLAKPYAPPPEEMASAPDELKS